MASLVNNSIFEYYAYKKTEKYWYRQDIRGSTTAIVGADGKLQKGYSYDTFGAIEESGSKSFLNEVTFTGSVTDTSTGLQYMNSRYYDSSTGRFLTQDSYSGSPYDPWTQHLYSYCGNNPVNMVDPTGHFTEALPWLGPIWGGALAEPSPFGEVFAVAATIGALLLAGDLSSSSNSSVTTCPANPPMVEYISKDHVAPIPMNPGKLEYVTKDRVLPNIPANPPMLQYVDKAAVKEKDKEVPIAIEKTGSLDSTPIYRWGSDSYYNLTPRATDYFGLSFTTVKPTGKNYVETTMQAVNSTGVLVAIQDSATHVSVRPTIPGLMVDWMNSKETANENPHFLTVVLKSITSRGR